MKQFSIQRIANERLEKMVTDKIDNLTKPKGSLGRLEELALQVSLIQQTPFPILKHPCNILFAADHGITEEGVSKSPKSITWQQLYNILRGGAGINFLCRQHDFDLLVVDAGVDYDFPPMNGLLDMICRYGSMEEALESLPEISLVLSNGTLFREKGRIESISGVINSSTGTVSLRAVFPNKGHILHSGASGNIRIPSEYKDCIVIPKSATYEIQDRIYVYKVGDDGLAVSAPIKVAEVSRPDEYIVTEGIDEGDEIVIEGVAMLHDGDRVKGQQTL